jgi:fructose-1,6-bisphosphatase/inositol monophosphatase family enzyme
MKEGKPMRQNYKFVCWELVELLMSRVSKEVMRLRQNAESDPDFTKLKADKTLVTKADELSEDLIRAWITQRFPDDAIRGEERPEKPGGSRLWIIDPIDGTYNFNHHGRMFGISVGMTEKNIPKLGVLRYPAEFTTLAAWEGGGAYADGGELEVSESPHQLQDARIWRVDTTLHGEYFQQPQFAKSVSQQNRLASPIPIIEGSQWCFTFTFLQFIRGHTDAIMHPGATPYDIGAMCAIARELGYPVSGYEGESIDFTKDTIPVVISKNMELHQEIINAMNVVR